jgi:hypothetical protein
MLATYLSYCWGNLCGRSNFIFAVKLCNTLVVGTLVENISKYGLSDLEIRTQRTDVGLITTCADLLVGAHNGTCSSGLQR